jgi:hypothetical protein
MRRGGSGSGVAGAGAESGGGLTGAGASGWAVAIDPVRVGAASSTSAGTGAETGAGLTGAGASGWAVAIDPVPVGAASSKDGLVRRRSWTRTPAASVARSVMGTMSVDFMVMGRLCRRSCRKSPNHAFHAGSNWMIRQSPTLRRLGNINIAAARCRRALRRSQSTTMRKLSYKDEGSWNYSQWPWASSRLSLVGGAGNGVLPRSL